MFDTSTAGRSRTDRLAPLLRRDPDSVTLFSFGKHAAAAAETVATHGDRPVSAADGMGRADGAVCRNVGTGSAAAPGSESLLKD